MLRNPGNKRIWIRLKSGSCVSIGARGETRQAAWECSEPTLERMVQRGLLTVAKVASAQAKSEQEPAGEEAKQPAGQKTKPDADAEGRKRPKRN